MAPVEPSTILVLKYHTDTMSKVKVTDLTYQSNMYVLDINNKVCLFHAVSFRSLF